MVKKNSIKLFGDDKIRAIWDDEQEKWYFSIVDVIAVLTESPNPQTYWRVLKKRLKDEGNETVTNCNALKMRAADGKMRLCFTFSISPLGYSNDKDLQFLLMSVVGFVLLFFCLTAPLGVFICFSSLCLFCGPLRH